MVAGRGVTHSERTSATARTGPNSLFGIQTWLALPESHEDVAPSFEHHGKETLPVIEELGRPEHNEFRWVDEQTALKLVSARVVPIIQWAAAKLAPSALSAQ